jgi:hypothetical protein
MTDSTYTANAAGIVLLLPHLSTDAHRPILNGLLLRADGVATATDGHTLGTVRDAHTFPDTIILPMPKEVKDLVKKAARKNADIWIQYTSKDHEYVRISAPTVIDSKLELRLIEGPYPNWPQVIPTTSGSLERVGVNPALLARFAGHAELSFVAADRAVVVRLTQRKDFLGVIMPLRLLEDMESEVPYWIHEPTLEEQAAVRFARERNLARYLLRCRVEGARFANALNGASPAELVCAFDEAKARGLDEARIEAISAEHEARQGWPLLRVVVIGGTAEHPEVAPGTIRIGDADEPQDESQRNISWLTTCPPSDGNYVSALERATLDELSVAESMMLASPKGNKTRLAAVQRRIRKLQEAEPAPEKPPARPRLVKNDGDLTPEQQEERRRVLSERARKAVETRRARLAEQAPAA